METTRALLARTAELAAGFLEGLDERPVYPRATLGELRAALGGPLPGGPSAPEDVVACLVRAVDPGLVASPGGRYFGFVIGGGLPAALAADWLTATWDQNAGLYACSPVAAAVEEVTGEWLRQVFSLPPESSFALVTGGQMANTTCLAAARNQVLARAGWDVERDGLTGAPRVRVVVGAMRHGTIDRGLRLLGLGAPSDVLEADDQGRMRTDGLDLGAEPTIVCAQAGEVNTGAVDPLEEIADACAAASNAWLHVDGAFGLWAAAAPSLRGLVRGYERADSWATDAHKWLNVPYDCGVALCAHPDAHRAAMSARSAYLVYGADERDAMDWTPESSRRARAFPVYAALRSLGSSGIAELVEGCCAHARRVAAGLRELGAEVLNEVVLNQVLVRFESDERTDAVLQAVQQSGEAWMSGTAWDGRRAVRISVSSWQTGDTDVERTLQAFRTALGSRLAAT